MSEAIRIDPETGRKVFNTRASKATDKIVGKGYSTVDDESLTTLPEIPAGTTFNAQEQAKYHSMIKSKIPCIPLRSWCWLVIDHSATSWVLLLVVLTASMMMGRSTMMLLYCERSEFFLAKEEFNHKKFL